MKRLVVFLLLLHFGSDAQIISTIAGNGSGTNSGDGGPATAATINYPSFSHFDKNGNLYLTTGVTGKTVREISPLGIITTVAGISGSGGYVGDGGSATTAKFGNPQCVTIDRFGNVYISDATYNVIRKIDVATGIITTIAGDGSGTYTGDGVLATNTSLWDPNGICFDPSGNLYIADYGNHRIRKVNTFGIISTFAGTGIDGYNGDGGLADTSKIAGAFDVCSDGLGNIYIADEANGRIRMVDTFGIIHTIAGNGIVSFSGDGGPATDAEVQPHTVTCDMFNNIYMLDQPRNRVRMINYISDTITTVAGNGIAGFYGDGGPATTAELNNAGGLTTDSCGNLYICEITNYRIRKVTFYDSCNTQNILNIKTNIPYFITIYPNPATASLSITASNKITQITISSLIGQVVYSQSYAIEKAEVNISGLPEGMYIVKVTDGEGREMITKIIKQ